MDNVHFEAKDYVNYLKAEGAIIRLAAYDGENCIGRGEALVINPDHRVAVMLMECGSRSGIKAGDFVNYVQHPEAPTEPRIVGTPGRVRG